MRFLKTAAAILALCATASASEGEVLDGSEWVGGGKTVTVDITLNATANTTSNSFTDDAGESPDAQGTPGENSSSSAPTTNECGATRTPGAEGEDYRIKCGKVQYKGDDGLWKNMKKKKKRSTQQSGYATLQVGEPAPSDGWLRSPLGRTAFLYQGTPAPFFGYFSPGEEQTSLPGGP